MLFLMNSEDMEFESSTSAVVYETQSLISALILTSTPPNSIDRRVAFLALPSMTFALVFFLIARLTAEKRPLALTANIQCCAPI